MRTGVVHYPIDCFQEEAAEATAPSDESLVGGAMQDALPLPGKGYPLSYLHPAPLYVGSLAVERYSEELSPQAAYEDRSRRFYRPGLAKMLVAAVAVLHLLLLLLTVSNLVIVLQEWPVRSTVYARLASSLQSTGTALADPSRYLTFPEGLSAENMRDMGFYLFNIRPEARVWMEKIPVSYEPNDKLAGWYRMDTRSLIVGQPYIHVVLHEYAHANLHRKGMAEKGRLLLAMVHLIADTAPEHQQARSVLHGVLVEGSQTMKEGGAYSLLHEAYAYLAQWSGGDLSALPQYLQPFYSDYLTAGPNRWLELQSGG